MTSSRDLPYIGVVVFVVMKLQCFSGHIGSQAVIGIRKIGKFKGHGNALLVMVANTKRPSIDLVQRPDNDLYGAHMAHGVSSSTIKPKGLINWRFLPLGVF